jgi:hypothetical protein
MGMPARVTVFVGNKIMIRVMDHVFNFTCTNGQVRRFGGASVFKVMANRMTRGPTGNITCLH